VEQALPPDHIRNLVFRIGDRVAGAKPWDVIARRQDDARFVEFKQPSEVFTRAEAKFVAGASQLGVDLRCFATVVGLIAVPGRPAPGQSGTPRRRATSG
jgi:hypothetical protein